MFHIKEKQKTFLQQKEKFWADDVARYDEELKRISNNISTLSNAKSQQIQVRDTSVVGVLEPRYPRAELRTNKVESMWKRIIGKVFKRKEK